MSTDGLLARVTGLHATLREAGVTGSPTSLVAAAQALEHVGWHDRAQLREALAATMLDSRRSRQLFDEAFDLFLPERGLFLPEGNDVADQQAASAFDGDGVDAQGEELHGAMSDDAVIDAVLEAIARGDEAALEALAREAVERFGKVASRDGTEAWFHYRVRRALGADILLERLAARTSDAASGLAPAWWNHVVEAEEHARVRAFERMVATEVRRRMAASRGVPSVARAGLPRSIVDRDFLGLDAEDRRRMDEEIRPLARKIATRMAIKRQAGRQGGLDVRRTVRRSLSTGGVPFHLVHRKRRAHRAELFVLCDVSGSVASFARFTLMLVHSLQAQIGRVRSFAFVDALDEVTTAMDRRDLAEAATWAGLGARVVAGDGHSDYGSAFADFQRMYADDLTPRSTLLILGDARNNYRQANAWILNDLSRRARHTWWLNPEPAGFWDTGDSIASAYARHVDAMVEARNLRQLTTFIERLG